MAEKTKRALAILQDAIDRDKYRKRMRYSHGFAEKPYGHDELNDAIERAMNADLNKASTKS